MINYCNKLAFSYSVDPTTSFIFHVLLSASGAASIWTNVPFRQHIRRNGHVTRYRPRCNYDYYLFAGAQNQSEEANILAGPPHIGRLLQTDNTHVTLFQTR